KSTLRIGLRNDFGVSYSNSLPGLGSTSHGLRVTAETWSTAHDVLTLEAVGVPAARYELSVWNPAQVASVDGAELKKGRLVVTFPSAANDVYSQQKITIHFAGGRR